MEQGWTLTKGGGREGFTSGYTIEGAEKMPRVTATDEQGWPGRNEGSLQITSAITESQLGAGSCQASWETQAKRSS